MVNVGGDPSGRSRETVTKQIQAAELVSIGQKCDLQLRIPGLQHTRPSITTDISSVVRVNAGWSRSPRAEGSLFLMLGVLRRIGQHGGRCDPSTVKRRQN